MQSSLVILFALLACAFAQPQWWSFSGTTNTSLSSAVAATWNDNDVCTPNTFGATPYENVTLTIPTSGAYFIYGLFAKSSVENAYINVYSTYTPATPCSGIVAIAHSTDGGAPHIYLPLTLTAGTYTFIITTSDVASAGVWAMHIYQADFSGNTNPGKNWWVVPDASGEVEDVFFTCANSSETAPYVSYNWTQSTTGMFDINIFFGNATAEDSSPEFIAALYNTSQPWVGTGTMDNVAYPCASPAGFYAGIQSDDDVTRVTSGYGTAGVFPTIMLTAGTVYTLVISGTDSDQIGPFGVRVSPTLYYQIGTTANYPAVPPNTDPADCVDESTGATLKVWRSFVFTAQWPTYVVDTGPTDVGFDTISELYAGNNAGVAYSIAPAACTGYLQCVDTGDVGPLSATGLLVGFNYTIVVTTYSSSSGTGWFTLWAFTGNTTGSIPNTSGNTATSASVTATSMSAGTTSAAATSATSTSMSAGTSASGHVTSASATSAGTSAGSSAGTSAHGTSATSSKSTGGSTGVNFASASTPNFFLGTLCIFTLIAKLL